MNIDFPSEKTIEDYIWSKLQDGICCPISGERYDFCMRQKEIKGYGVTDIIKVQACESIISITVLELKNEFLKESHISQLYRYMTGIRRIADMYSRRIKDCPEIHIHGELAGPFNKDRGDFVFLLQGLSNITCYELSIDFDSGFKSEEISDSWSNKSEKKLSYKKEVRRILDHHREAERLFMEAIRGPQNSKVTSIGRSR